MLYYYNSKLFLTSLVKTDSFPKDVSYGCLRHGRYVCGEKPLYFW